MAERDATAAPDAPHQPPRSPLRTVPVLEPDFYAAIHRRLVAAGGHDAAADIASRRRQRALQHRAPLPSRDRRHRRGSAFPRPLRPAQPRGPRRRRPDDRLPRRPRPSRPGAPGRFDRAAARPPRGRPQRPGLAGQRGDLVRRRVATGDDDRAALRPVGSASSPASAAAPAPSARVCARAASRARRRRDVVVVTRTKPSSRVRSTDWGSAKPAPVASPLIRVSAGRGDDARRPARTGMPPGAAADWTATTRQRGRERVPDEAGTRGAAPAADRDVHRLEVGVLAAGARGRRWRGRG